LISIFLKLLALHFNPQPTRKAQAVGQKTIIQKRSVQILPFTVVKNYSIKGAIHLLLTTGIISISFSYLTLLSYVSNLGQELRLSKKLPTTWRI